MLKIVFYVPIDHFDVVTESMFVAGAGNSESYDKACWRTLGQGQFVPSGGSDPFLGDEGDMTRVGEYRVEMLCPEGLLPQVITSLIDAHPYEEPAWEFTSVETTME